MSWPARKNGNRLIDAVLFVRFQVLHPALFDQLDHPPRIEIDAKANAAAMLRQMLDGQSQSPRAGGPKHQPVGPFGKILLRQRIAEQRIVGAKIVDRDAALGNAGRAAGFEHVNRLVGQRLGHPAPHRPAAEPFVLKLRKLFQIVERPHFLQRIEFQLLGLFQPERAARRWMKMPLHRFIDMGIELIAGGLGKLGDIVGHGKRNEGTKIGDRKIIYFAGMILPRRGCRATR